MGENTPPPLPGDDESPQPDVELPQTPVENGPSIPDLPESPRGKDGGTPPGMPPPNAPTTPSSPLPFLILLGIVLIGGGIWYYLKQVSESQNTTGRIAEKKIKPYSGDIPENGKAFMGIWKGFDADEDTPTNWEILRNSDYSFTALIKKFHEDDLSVLSLSGSWRIKSKQIHYNVKADYAEGPDMKWPDSWQETIGDLSDNRLKLQALSTESRRGPFFEVRAPGFGYRQMKSIEVDDSLILKPLPQTESPAKSVPGDMIVHYNFDEGAKNLVGDKHSPNMVEANLTSEDLPLNFKQAVGLSDKDSRIEITGTDDLPLAEVDFCVSLWLRIKGSRADGFGILGSISDGKNLSHTGIGIRTHGQGNPGAPEFLFYHRDAKYRFRGDTKLNTGEWHHLAVTKSGYLGQIYVNGQPEGKLGTIYRRTGDGTTSLSIGKFLDTGLPNGAVDNFRLYMRSLSPEEILAIYESERHIPIAK